MSCLPRIPQKLAPHVFFEKQIFPYYDTQLLLNYGI